MNRKEAKELLPVIEAYAEGKAIQYRAIDGGYWYDVEDGREVDRDRYEFRVKPEPKYRPFKDAEECWNEMLKHEPFGWVMDDVGYELISSLCDVEDEEGGVDIYAQQKNWSCDSFFQDVNIRRRHTLLYQGRRRGIMETNKITIAKSDNGGYNIMTTSTNTPMCYAELDSLMYEIASAMEKYDRRANNECEANPQWTESDVQLAAIKKNAVSHAQAKVMHLAKVLMGTDEPFTEGMENFFRTLATTAFFHGWDSCCDNYGLEQGGEE